MTRRELVKALASRDGLPRRAADEVVNAVIEAMREALCDGGRVEIRGFGTLRPRHYPSYAGRNPRTAARVVVERKVLPVFKPGRDLLRLVNQGAPGRTEE